MASSSPLSWAPHEFGSISKLVSLAICLAETASLRVLSLAGQFRASLQSCLQIPVHQPPYVIRSSELFQLLSADMKCRSKQQLCSTVASTVRQLVRPRSFPRSSTFKRW